MATRPKPRPLRVVIDTHVVVSALVFKRSTVVAIRRVCESGECVPVVSRATAEELIRVLRYPKFGLDRDQQHAVLAEYLPHCKTVPAPKTHAKLPKCRDEDDQPFLLLAAACEADVLITGDKDLLALKGLVSPKVLTPGEFLTLLGGG